MEEVNWVQLHWPELVALVGIAVAWGHNMQRISNLEKRTTETQNLMCDDIKALTKRVEKGSDEAKRVGERLSGVEATCNLILEEVRRHR